MKQRKCPNGKHGGCWDYGSCEDCPIGILIERYEKKVKILKSNNANLTVENEVLQSEKENLMRTVEEGGEEIESARKETAKEIIHYLLKLGHNGLGYIKIYVENIEELIEKYGVEVEE